MSSEAEEKQSKRSKKGSKVLREEERKRSRVIVGESVVDIRATRIARESIVDRTLYTRHETSCTYEYGGNKTRRESSRARRSMELRRYMGTQRPRRHRRHHSHRSVQQGLCEAKSHGTTRLLDLQVKPTLYILQAVRFSRNSLTSPFYGEFLIDIIRNWRSHESKSASDYN